MLLSNLFIIFGILFSLSIIVGKIFIFKMKDTMFVSNYIVLIAVFLGAYSLIGLFLIFKVPFLYFKLFFLFVALSPFLLGQIASYKTEKIFTFLQVIIVLFSVVLCKLYF